MCNMQWFNLAYPPCTGASPNRQQAGTHVAEDLRCIGLVIWQGQKGPRLLGACLQNPLAPAVCSERMMTRCLLMSVMRVSAPNTCTTTRYHRLTDSSDRYSLTACSSQKQTSHLRCDSIT